MKLKELYTVLKYKKSVPMYMLKDKDIYYQWYPHEREFETESHVKFEYNKIYDSKYIYMIIKQEDVPWI